MSSSRLSRALVPLVALVLLLSLSVSVVGAAGAPGAPGAAWGATDGSVWAQEGTPTEQPDSANNSTGGGAPPSAAETARVTPVRFEEEYLSTAVAEPDSVFNTSGPFAVFSISEPLESVRISQQGADAELMEGGQTVVVRYAEDAAPDPQRSSLYTLELYYQDGSTETVRLYASGTDVSVEAAVLESYRGFIFEVREDAREEGYAENPDGVSTYYEDTKEQADLLNSLFVQQAAQAVATVLAWVLNPFAIGITLGLVALGSYYRLHRRGYSLDVISGDPGRAARQRESFRLSYKEHQQTADEERLQELHTVGPNAEIYWRDAQEVSTVYQLAELARNGRKVKRDGETVQQHSGVDALDAASLDNSWLETVAGPGRQRIASYDIALGHLKTALERMMSKYGMGHVYRGTYETVVELIDERQQLVAEGSFESASSGSGSGATAAGGD